MFRSPIPSRCTHRTVRSLRETSQGTLQRSQRRLVQTNSQFEPLRPPSPSSLGKPRTAREFNRSRRWGRRLLILAAVAGSAYAFDHVVFASGIARSARTFSTGILVAIDYKLNWRPDPWVGNSVEDVHRRAAERLFELLHANGGLYLKIGQAIAMQSALLPPEFSQMFARMFDDAPQVEWKDVERVIREDFGGKSAEEVFGVSFTGEEGKGLIERKARASASIAQVHWARLPDGREVAIKIQKPDIAKQVGWDLWAFQVMTRIYSYWFELPLYTVVPFITERLTLETDFMSEAENSETMKKLISDEPSLKGRIYVPTVYPEFTSRRILVSEWIEGVRLWDREAIRGRWAGGYGKGSPGVRGEKLQFTEADMKAAQRELRENPHREQLKPERTAWRGYNGKGGLGLSGKDVMASMVELFSAQIFKWGTVHCDPHPGNIFIRRLPSGKAEMVLIDHGLYVYMSPKFRHQYTLFWKSMMTFDNETIAEISHDWGINAPDLFASATLMRPYEGGEEDVLSNFDPRTDPQRQFDAQEKMKDSIREMLKDGDRWPQELIFIGRNMRIVQGNNQYMGSPVNRIKIMGNWASSALYQDPDMPWHRRLLFAFRHVLFKTVLLGTDIAFYMARIRQLLGWGGGMEEEMHARMQAIAKDMGIELQHGIFEG